MKEGGGRDGGLYGYCNSHAARNPPWCLVRRGGLGEGRYRRQMLNFLAGDPLHTGFA